VLEDNSDNLWIRTTDESLYKYNLKSKKIEEYSYKTGNAKGLGSGFIAFIFSDTKDRIWVGTLAGLSLFNPITNTFRTFYVDPINKSSEYNFFVYGTEDDNGNLAFGIWKNPENYTVLFNFMKIGQGTFYICQITPKML
jgi:ligand-binding sensor domain-containing protein